MKGVTHNAFHLLHGAYGRNHDISETALPRVLTGTAFINSASCELKFH